MIIEKRILYGNIWKINITNSFIYYVCEHLIFFTFPYLPKSIMKNITVRNNKDAVISRILLQAYMIMSSHKNDFKVQETRIITVCQLSINI